MASRVEKPHREKPRIHYGFMILAAPFLSGSGRSLLDLFQNHQTMNSETVLAKSIGAAVAFAIGYFFFKRATSQKNVSAYVPPAEKKGRKVFALIGFVFGMIACAYMFMASAAGAFETELAQKTQLGSQVIAALLLILSLFAGFIGFFLQRFALGRVSLYFWVGGILTYSAFWVLRIDLAKFDQVAQLLQ